MQLAISIFIYYVFSKCEKINIRKEIRDLSPQEVQRFTSAILKLNEKNNDEEESIYDSFSTQHYENSGSTHGTPLFFPWHREFLTSFERELQKIEPEVVLPYWDWTIDHKDPESSPLFSPDFFGGNGNPDEGQCVTDGPFANFNLKYPEPHCLKRQFYKGARMSSFTSPSVIIELLYRDQSYDKFREEIEFHHGDVHVNIGGENGDMYPHYSPNDPFFFLHHSFIDMLWWTWQQIHPNRKTEYNGLNSDDKEATIDDRVEGYDVKIRDTFDTDNYCYTYKNFAPLANEYSAEELKNRLDTNNFVDSADHLPLPKSLNETRSSELQVLAKLIVENRPFLNPNNSKISARTSLLKKEAEISDLKLKFMQMNNMNVTLAKIVSFKNKLLDTLVKNMKSNEPNKSHMT